MAADTPNTAEKKPFTPPEPNVSYTVEFKDLCADHPEILLSYEEIKKHGRRHPYNFKKQEKKDSLILSFELIDDCGRKYIGDAWQGSNGNLILGFFPPADSMRVADCSCNSRLTYRILKDSVEWKEIYISSGFSWKESVLMRFGEEVEFSSK